MVRIHHVACLVICQGHPVGVDAVVEEVGFRGKKRSRQVVIAVGYKGTEVGILAHGLPQMRRDVDKRQTVVRAGPPSVADGFVVEDLVAASHVHVEDANQVVVDGRDERAADAVG